MRAIMLGGMVWALTAGAVRAHAGEQGFVLLLPTTVYIAAGGITVALTVALLAVLPGTFAERLFRPVRLFRLHTPLVMRYGLNLAVTALLGWLVWRGLVGPGDPGVNPLPLAIWVVFWIVLVTLQGLVGDLWRWINPWVGVGALLRRLTGMRAPLRYPRGLGYWPGVLGFLAFCGFGPDRSGAAGGGGRVLLVCDAARVGALWPCLAGPGRGDHGADADLWPGFLHWSFKRLYVRRAIRVADFDRTKDKSGIGGSVPHPLGIGQL